MLGENLVFQKPQKAQVPTMTDSSKTMSSDYLDKNER